MSIALSLLIRPSRHLQMAVYGLCAMILIGGLTVSAGVVGSFPIPARIVILSVALLSVASAGIAFYRSQKTWRMHVSPEGAIRLCEEANAQCLDDASKAFRLLPESTLWSGVMLLRLQSDARECVTLHILSDSVGPHEFRLLSVAMRWIAARGASDERVLQG